MNLTNTKSYVETQQFSQNGEWDLRNTSVKWQEIELPCCPDMRYPYVSFTLSLQRRYTYYTMNIIIPCVLLSTLIMMIFWVPPDVGEKITAGISVLLAFAVFLLMIADNVPRTSLSVPILGECFFFMPISIVSQLSLRNAFWKRSEVTTWVIVA